jgi:hypothetical protein
VTAVVRISAPGAGLGVDVNAGRPNSDGAADSAELLVDVGDELPLGVLKIEPAPLPIAPFAALVCWPELAVPDALPLKAGRPFGSGWDAG